MYKWERRQAKYNSRKNRMPKHGRSLFLIEDITRMRAEKIKAGRKNKLELQKIEE